MDTLMGISQDSDDLAQEIASESESERLYRVLFEQSPYGVLLINDAGHMVKFNKAAHRNLGYTRKEFQRLTLADIDPVESPERIQKRIEKILKEGKAEFYVTHQTKHGENRDVQVITQPIVLSDRVHFHTIWIDVTEQRRAERIRRESEVKFRTLFESANDGILILSLTGTIIDTNTTAHERLGYTKEELVGLPITKINSPESANLVAERMRLILSRGRAVFEVAQRRKDGTFMPVEASVRLAEIGGEQVLLSITRDITDKKRAEEKLAQNLNMIKHIIDSIPQTIFWKDRQGTFLGCNQRFCQTLGFASPDAVVGKNDLDMPLPHEDIEAYLADDREVIDYNRPKQHIIRSVRHGDGPRIWIDTTKVPLVDETGTVYGLLGVYEDISERKRMEDEVNAANRMLQNLIQAIPDMVFYRDPDGRYLMVNKVMAESTGLTVEGLIGKTNEDFMPPEMAEMCRRSDQAAINSGRPTHSEESYTGPDGRTIHLDTIKTCVYDDEGGYTGLLAIARDITERKLVEEKLQQNLNEKDILLKEVHHRVKNNMAVISSLLGLQAKALDDPTIRGLFDESRQRIKSMALVHEKLYRTKDLSAINFGEYIKEIIKDLLSSYKRGRAVATHINAQDIMLDLDTAIPCGLIVNELVTNSLKYAFPDPASGELTVCFEKTGNTYTLTIQDNGVGLPKGFDHTAVTSLGLQLVAALTKQIKGTLRFRAGGVAQPGTAAIITFMAKELAAL